MKVTRVIRDYVEKQVKEIYAPKFEKIGEDYNAKLKELDKKIDAEVSKLNKKLLPILTENGFCIRYGGSSVVSKSGFYNKEMEDKIRTEKWNLEKEMNSKVNDILACLELGATKDDLDKMILDLKKALK